MNKIVSLREKQYEKMYESFYKNPINSQLSLSVFMKCDVRFEKSIKVVKVTKIS